MYKAAGTASLKPSLEKTELYSCSNITVAGVLGGRVLEISYSEKVRLIANLMTSFRKTAVDVKYL